MVNAGSCYILCVCVGVCLQLSWHTQAELINWFHDSKVWCSKGSSVECAYKNQKSSKGWIKFAKEMPSLKLGSNTEASGEIKYLFLCFSPVADTFFQLGGPGADLLVVFCLKYQTTSINLQRQRCFQMYHWHQTELHCANAGNGINTL